MKRGVVKPNVKGNTEKDCYSDQVNRGASGGVMRGSNPEPEAPKQPLRNTDQASLETRFVPRQIATCSQQRTTTVELRLKQ